LGDYFCHLKNAGPKHYISLKIYRAGEEFYFHYLVILGTCLQSRQVNRARFLAPQTGLPQHDGNLSKHHMNTPKPPVGIRYLGTSAARGVGLIGTRLIDRYRKFVFQVDDADRDNDPERNGRHRWNEKFEVDRFLGHRELALTYPAIIDATFC
jgi:hypothetical protein